MEWFPSLEASSVDLIEAYVASGLGIGVSVAIPKKILPSNVRTLLLPGFSPVIVGALWRGRKTPLLQTFLDELQVRANLLA